MTSAGRADRLYRSIAGHAGWWLLGTAAVTALAVLAVVDPRTATLRLDLDPSNESMLPVDDPGRAFLDRIVETFGSGESVLVALAGEDVFTKRGLERIRRITERIEELDLVERVSSLSTAVNIRSGDGTLVVEPFFDDPPDTPEGLAELRRRAHADPIYAGNLVSRDARVSVLNVQLLDVPEKELLESGVDGEIARIAEEESDGAEVWVAGSPVVKAAVSRGMLQDSSVLIPVASALMALVALLSFRTLRGMLIPILTVLLALVWTLAVVALVYGSMNMITVAAPPIVLVVGFAYAIHVVSAYYDVLRGEDADGIGGREAVVRALHHVAVPVVFTALTTAAGFLSLTTSPLGAIREFGTFCGVGVLSAMLVSLTFSPALLALLPPPRRVAHGGDPDPLDRFFSRLADFDIRNRRGLLASGAVLFVLALVGTSQIQIGTATIGNFKSESAVRRHFDLVNENLEGANGFRVIVESPIPDAFKDPAHLRVLAELQVWLEDQPEVGGTTSLADYVKAIHRGLSEDATADALPGSQELVSQLLLIGANEELPFFVDSAYQVANVAVRTAATDSAELVALADRIEARLEGLAEPLRGTVTGNSVLLARTMDEIAYGQALSLGTAFVIIYAILALLFTSFREGLLALIPNALPVAIYFGVLGWTGVTLNTTTGLVACLVLGIAVDDTIHMLAQVKAESKRVGDQTKGVRAALRTVGRPVTYTTLALCLGFACLTQSEMRSTVEFGLLSAFTLSVAWLVDVTFTPALALGMRIVTLWDVLSLDLGESPERSIPLFRGLRATQARVVALLSRLTEFPAGHVLMRTGDPGSVMYVIIDGELESSVVKDGGRVALGTHSRGDVIGEVALFQGKRTADVRACTPVRLLEITQGSLARLERHRPRIASRVNANLNHVLAARLARLTTRVA